MSPSSNPQVMTALRRGNEVKSARAAFKRRLRAGDADLAIALDPSAEIPDGLRSMTIFDALMAQRQWGRHRVRRLLTFVGVGELRRLDALTTRERRVLAEAIRRVNGEEIPVAV